LWIHGQEADWQAKASATLLTMASANFLKTKHNMDVKACRTLEEVRAKLRAGRTLTDWTVDDMEEDNDSKEKDPVPAAPEPEVSTVPTPSAEVKDSAAPPEVKDSSTPADEPVPAGDVADEAVTAAAPSDLAVVEPIAPIAPVQQNDTSAVGPSAPNSLEALEEPVMNKATMVENLSEEKEVEKKLQRVVVFMLLSRLWEGAFFFGKLVPLHVCPLSVFHSSVRCSVVLRRTVWHFTSKLFTFVVLFFKWR